MRFAISITAVLLLGACSSAQPEPAPEPPPAPAPAPPPPAAPALPDDWTEWPIADGDWVYREDDRGSIALFGKPNSDAMLTIRCDTRQRRVYISRAGTIAAPSQMTLRAHSGLQQYEARNSGGALPYAAVQLSPGDIMLDRIIYARGFFAVQLRGTPSIAVPNWSEIARVVEDCRS